MGSFARGFTALFRALPLAFEDRRLLRLTVAPAALALVLTFASAAAVYHYSHLLVVRSAWMWIVVVLAVAAGLWVGWVLSCMVATAPFAEALSARASELAGAPAPPPQPWHNALVGMGHTLLSVLIYALIATLLLVAQWIIPVLAPFTAVAGLLATAQFLAYDLYDPTLSRRGASFAEKWRYLAAHRGETLGLGLAAALGIAVPFLGILVVPLGTIAAARLHATQQ
jgi:uncharacterized protein involved in cysteine biosynthesis